MIARCKHQIPNKWYHVRRHPGTHHQCPFPARKNGYCTRHHPSRRLATLKRELARIEKRLRKIGAEMAEIKVTLRIK